MAGDGGDHGRGRRGVERPRYTDWPSEGRRAILAAVEQHQRLEADTQRLASEVADLREALDRRAVAAKRLAELDRSEDRDERRKAIETAEAAFNMAKSQAATLRAAEAELRLVQERSRAVDAELKTFRTGLERAAKIKTDLAEAAHRRADALARREAAAEATVKARMQSEAAETREQEARALLTRLDAALKARDAAENLVKLEKALEAAEAAARVLRKARQRWR